MLTLISTLLCGCATCRAIIIRGLGTMDKNTLMRSEIGHHLTPAGRLGYYATWIHSGNNWLLDSFMQKLCLCTPSLIVELWSRWSLTFAGSACHWGSPQICHPGWSREQQFAMWLSVSYWKQEWNRALCWPHNAIGFPEFLMVCCPGIGLNVFFVAALHVLRWVFLLCSSLG